jgi:hypothetical protein
MPKAAQRMGRFAVLAAVAALALGACSRYGNTGMKSETSGPSSTESVIPEGLRRGYAKGAAGRSASATVTVNRFAWRASLDAVSFMPLRTSDPYGGVIATDWYISESNSNERLRVNILVSGPELRSDTVDVTIFRQEKDARGTWVAKKVAPTSDTDFENVILTRARTLRDQVR